MLKKMSSIICWVTVLLLLFGSAVFAGNAGENDVNTQSVPQKVIELKPSPNNYVDLTKVQLVKYDSDHVTIIAEGSKKVGTPFQLFEITVDPQKGTYQTIKKELSADLKEVFSSELQTNNQFQTQSTSYWSGTVSVLTEDPIQIDCAKTTHKLVWSINDQNEAHFFSRTLSTWDGQPTYGLTYWYTQWKHFIGDPSLIGYFSAVQSEAEAQHYNDDFLYNDQRTWAYHYIRITGRNDQTFDWKAYWDHWGEASGNLHASAFVE